MITNVVMKRPLFGLEISQRSDNQFLSMTDLIRVGNKWRLSNGLGSFDYKVYFKSKNVQEFVETLEKQYGVVRIAGRGRGKHTWLHPILFIDMALSISPELKIEVYQWLYDNLIAFRNDSGDSYKKMCGNLFANSKDKTHFAKFITDTAHRIQLACNTSDWQIATEHQLKLRDRIHENIAILSNVLRNNNEAVRLGIMEAIK